MAEHTPTPYRASGDLVFASDNILARVHDGQAPGDDWMEGIAHANAAYIVRACNSHEALLAACEVGFDVALRFHDEAAADILTAAIANAKAGAV